MWHIRTGVFRRCSQLTPCLQLSCNPAALPPPPPPRTHPQYRDLPQLMTQVAREELTHMNEDIEACSIVYLPQLGFLLKVPSRDQRPELHVDGLEFMFTSEDASHYRSPRTRVLDVTLGDCHCDIIDRENEICDQLIQRVLRSGQELIDAVSTVPRLRTRIATLPGPRHPRPHFWV